MKKERVQLLFDKIKWGVKEAITEVYAILNKYSYFTKAN
jgi:hypothetical protein